MTMHYLQTPIDDVKPGMVLSDDLLDHQGKVLLAHGVCLTEATIEALRRHQVVTVPIATGEATGEETVVEQTQYAERLLTLYRKLPDDELSAASTLRWYVRDFRLGVSV